MIKYFFKLSIIIICLLNSSYADSTYKYKIFNNEFQAVFPNEPNKKYIPNPFKNKDVEVYTYFDEQNKLVFQVQIMDIHIKYNTKKLQNLIDMSIKKSLPIYNKQIVDFSSSFNQYNNSYVVIYTSLEYIEGQAVYQSIKEIVYKDRIYKWCVTYQNFNNKSIFNKYSKYCKLIE